MTALAELSGPADTALLGETSVWAPRSLLGAVKLEREGDEHGYPLALPWLTVQGQPVGPDWVNLGGPAKLILFIPSSAAAFGASAPAKLWPEIKPTHLVSLPSFEALPSTGDIFNVIHDDLVEIWSQPVTAWPSFKTTSEGGPLTFPIAGAGIGIADSPTYSEAVLLDIPAALKRARSQAGLPVQDLAAMFGIGRRQFYNLVSEEQTTDDERAARIHHVTEAIGQVSKWVGNSRKVRSLLLARIDGDSIYDAAVAADENRMSLALDRAYSAAAQATRLPPRLAPSQRATSSEAVAIRDFLSATGDDSDVANER